MQRVHLSIVRSHMSMVKTQQICDKISLKKLQADFRDHFSKEYKKYEMPLLSTEGVLSYTSRFAKTVINQEYDEDQRKEYFMIIKKSLNSNKKFTSESCIDSCESLINFSFEGEENRILEKLRNFVKANERVLSSKQADRFIRAHKYLMMERAEGPIKFKDFKLNSPKTERQLLQQKVKKLFKENKIRQFQIDFIGKIQMMFEMDLYGIIRTIKMIGYDQSKSKEDQMDVLAKKILQIGSKEKDLIVINSDKSDHKISSQKLAEKLLKNQQYHLKLSEVETNTQVQTFFQKIVKRLTECKTSASNNIKLSLGTNISYLNYVLENNSNDQLKELFGYAKMNLFHIEFENILLMINKARKVTTSQLDRLIYTDLFEQQEQDYYHIIPREQLNAKAIMNILRQSKCKRLVIICNEQKMPTIIHHIFKLLKASIDFDLQKENRNPSALLSKLTFASLLYQIPVEVPKIYRDMNKYRQLLHPITHPFRFQR